MTGKYGKTCPPKNHARFMLLPKIQPDNSTENQNCNKEALSRNLKNKTTEVYLNTLYSKLIFCDILH